ncbi:MAG: phospholipase/Carboxylesterase [Thermoleophilia bacterium]|nr:phospholipase/Carboxylesterase [Thermoleophilia bacterium]
MTDTRLIRRDRPAVPADSPSGLLVLLHGRGADGNDLFPLIDMIDPERRLHGVTFQAPAQLPGSPGWHWYEVHRVGHPHPPTFFPSLEALQHDVDALLVEHGLTHDRLVLAGFSQGAVMSIATAFAPGRPAPAAVLPWSGFVPTVEGWELDPAAAADVPVLLTHGALDPVIVASFGHDAKARLEAAGAAVEWREPAMGHELDPATVVRARQLLDELFG